MWNNLFVVWDLAKSLIQEFIDDFGQKLMEEGWGLGKVWVGQISKVKARKVIKVLSKNANVFLNSCKKNYNKGR